jgi:hypothetical protein
MSASTVPIRRGVEGRPAGLPRGVGRPTVLGLQDLLVDLVRRTVTPVRGPGSARDGHMDVPCRGVVEYSVLYLHGALLRAGAQANPRGHRSGLSSIDERARGL